MPDDSKMKGSRIISPFYQTLICTQKVKVQYDYMEGSVRILEHANREENTYHSLEPSRPKEGKSKCLH